MRQKNTQNGYELNINELSSVTDDTEPVDIKSLVIQGPKSKLI